jgi:hypothetical protein
VSPQRKRLTVGLSVGALVAIGVGVMVASQQPEVPPGPPPDFDVGCAVDDVVVECVQGVKLVFSLAPNGYEHFAAVIDLPTGAQQWVYPRAEAGSSLDLRSVASNGVMNDALKLEGGAGDYVVHGTFAHAPMDRESAQQALSQPTPQYPTKAVTIHLP